MNGDEAFPAFPDHRSCETMTQLVVDHLPEDPAFGHERHYHPEENIWEPRDTADRIYFLRAGQVSEHRGDPEEHGVIVRLIDPGEAFGELCFCTPKGGSRPTTARAVVESRIIEVSLKDFLAFLRRSRDALPALVYTFCTRLAGEERRVEVLSHRGAETRLGHLLLQLVATHGRAVGERKDEKSIEMTHENLAAMAAMNRSHVTLTLGKLREKGLISYGRDQVLVVHERRLRAYLKSPLGPGET